MITRGNEIKISGPNLNSCFSGGKGGQDKVLLMSEFKADNSVFIVK
jgi:hypothetical protein